MAGSDTVETETPIFTEEEIYLIGGFIAARLLDTSLGDDDEENEMVVELIEEAVQVVLSLGR